MKEFPLADPDQRNKDDNINKIARKEHVLRKKTGDHSSPDGSNPRMEDKTQINNNGLQPRNISICFIEEYPVAIKVYECYTKKI